MRNPPVGDIQNAHIHTGAAGVNGGIFIDLEVPSATIDPFSGVMTGTITPTLAQIARVCNAFDQFGISGF